MLSRAVKEHANSQAAAKLENERLRKEAVASVGAVTQEIVDRLNTNVARVFTNQKALEAEAKNLQQLSTRHTKQVAQWVTMVESFNQSLKEIGDVENWSRLIEADMKVVSTTLEYVHNAMRPPPPTL